MSDSERMELMMESEKDATEQELARLRKELAESLEQNLTKSELMTIIHPLWKANLRLVSAVLDALTSVRMLANSTDKNLAAEYAESAWKVMPEVLEHLERLEPAIKKLLPELTDAAWSKGAKDE